MSPRRSRLYVPEIGGRIVAGTRNCPMIADDGSAVFTPVYAQSTDAPGEVAGVGHGLAVDGDDHVTRLEL
jgi:hypothetical protein